MNNNMNNNMMNNNMNMMDNNMNNLVNSFSKISLSESNFLNNNINNSLNNNFNVSTPLNLNNSANIPFNDNSEITMKFTFMATQVFFVKGRLKEKFSDVVQRFKDNQCPEELKNQLSVPVHSGIKVKKEKTLSELGIKEGDIVLFINRTGNNEDEDRELTPEEKMKIDKIINQLAELYIFLKFLDEMERNGGNKNVIKEHDKLVYTITNFDWQCKTCNKKYNKSIPKYYCSGCDYCMCNECYTNRNYPKKKEFPQNVIPTNPSVKEKYYDAAYHNHKLVYCRTSRNSEQLNGWICDNCRENYDNEVWSFYCTKCDFDLCCSCMGFN